jgi:hypothetical protein
MFLLHPNGTPIFFFFFFFEEHLRWMLEGERFGMFCLLFPFHHGALMVSGPTGADIVVRLHPLS